MRFRTPQVQTEPAAAVLLPAGYDHPRNRSRRYPVLFLFHGGGGDHTQWYEQLGAVQTAEGHEVIIVMPDCNLVGWHANHMYPTGARRNWKNFHIQQLLPWVDANFRTIPDGSARAVAGLSMGGYGAQKYVAEYPDLFAAVSSYSGPSNNLDPVLETWIFFTVGLDMQVPGAVYGPVGVHRDRMKRENPWNRVPSFRGKRVVMYAGKAPVVSPNVMADVQEHVVHAQNMAFSRKLTNAGIANQFHDYPGTHSGEYWTRSFREDLPGIVAALRRATG